MWEYQFSVVIVIVSIIILWKQFTQLKLAKDATEVISGRH
jgi:hypothetical protein